MNQVSSNSQTYNAMKERGRLYLGVFRELSERYGRDEAVSVLRSVSNKLGAKDGKPLACHAPCNFAGLLEDFFMAPDDGATFSTDVRQLNDTCLDVQSMSCPIKDSWVEAGCSDEEVCTLLYCASAYDHAVFEAAGFDLDLELWSPGKQGCCHAVITRKPQI